MNPLQMLGAGVAALFFVSIAIVFLSSWILGRSRGYAAQSAPIRHRRHEEFGELDDSPPLGAGGYAAEEPQGGAAENSLIQEILSVDLPDEVPANAGAGAQPPSKAEEPKNPLVSLIEEFDFSGESEISRENPEESEDSSFRELLGEEEEPAPEILEEIEKKSYTGYPDCFGNKKDCNRSCSFAEECRRTVEILGEFI